MNVEFKRAHIVKDPANKVTSHLIYQPHMRQNPNNLKFHHDGIFSKRIFGNFSQCDCGAVRGQGYCKDCDTRVIDKNNMPDFYIDLPCHVPIFLAKWESLQMKKGFSMDLARSVCTYKAFEYEGQFYIIIEDGIHKIGDDERIDSSEFDPDKVFIGLDALRSICMNADEFWDENMDDYIPILHTSFRPLVLSSGTKPIVTNINGLYMNLIQKINEAIGMGEFAQNNLYMLVQYQSIVRLYDEINQDLLKELQDAKYSLMRAEMISHPISGAVRAVLTNRHDVNEDVILVGDTLIKTLFPFLYEKYHGNMIEINKALIETNAFVLVNRPPTISHLSIMALRPRVASCYPYQHIEGTNGCLDHNEKYCTEHASEIGVFPDEDGDIERFSIVGDDGVDPIGLRVVSINPIVCDGYAADFDGDVLLVIAIYGNEAKSEAERILPSRSFTNYANGTIRNKIVKDFLLSLPEPLDMSKLNSLPRSEYVAENQKMASTLWEREEIPTVGDLSEFLSGKPNEKTDAIFSFLGNADDFSKMAARRSHDYTQSESSQHIETVMAANNREISDAGYFYFLLMASSDDFRVIDSNCNGDGVEMKVSDIDEDTFNYRVRYMYVNEAHRYMRFDYTRFQKWVADSGATTIHVRTPLTCNHLHRHGICRKCAGALPANVNVGLFTTLMVTESATQSALSSMNKGKKRNINEVLKGAYKGPQTWEDITQWINENVAELQNPNVSARFYEIALLSRVRLDDGVPFVASLKGSINYSGNPFGRYIFQRSFNALREMVHAGSFEDNSMKLQIAVNLYDG